VLHRDVKPQNILLDRQGVPYLTDFGLVRLLDQPGTTRAGVFVGTPHYASPEQAEMRELDVRSDIYSLGLVVFEMATGRQPFQGESTREVLDARLRNRPPAPDSLRGDLPEPLSRLIQRCLEKETDRRFDSAEELLSALERIDLDS
jgi:serine/threonine-protein kinase